MNCVRTDAERGISGPEGGSCWRSLAGVGEEVDRLGDVSRIWIGEDHELQVKGMGPECGIDYPT